MCNVCTPLPSIAREEGSLNGLLNIFSGKQAYSYVSVSSTITPSLSKSSCHIP